MELAYGPGSHLASPGVPLPTSKKKGSSHLLHTWQQKTLSARSVLHEWINKMCYMQTVEY